MAETPDWAGPLNRQMQAREICKMINQRSSELETLAFAACLLCAEVEDAELHTALDELLGATTVGLGHALAAIMRLDKLIEGDMND